MKVDMEGGAVFSKGERRHAIKPVPKGAVTKRGVGFLLPRLIQIHNEFKWRNE